MNIDINHGKLSMDRLFLIENFGHSMSGAGYLFRPTHLEQIEALFEAAREHGFSIGLRGAGRSYGDAAMNRGGAILDLQRMNRMLDWNPETGVLKVEPGFTIEDMWKYTLEDGWWGPVMPGTMKPTLGGALGANIHGKNNWKMGPIGEHVLEFTALLPSGEKITCTPKRNKNLFHAMIGGMGMLGVFTSITIQLKKIHSGNLRVRAWTEPTYADILRATDEGKDNDYIVGWIDATARGDKLGRGQMHSGTYLQPGEDPYPAQSLNRDSQSLPPNIMGVVPRSIVWQIMRMALINPGVRVGNAAKYWLNYFTENNKESVQSFIAFNFLLDYVPSWERAYGKGGLIQYQTFLPKETAHDAHIEMLRLSQMRGLPSYLGVVKRHRPDNFLLSHAVDGFSLALDMKVPRNNRGRLYDLAQEMNQIVVQAGGRFYFAKDATLTAATVEASLGVETVKKFRKLKKKYDPDMILQTDLYRRCFEQ